MLEQAFEVATEFRFDVGQAVFNTNAMTKAVDSLNSAVGAAQTGLQYLAGGLVAHLGLGSGGLLSVLTRAVQLTEEFNVGQMGFVNSISSNMNVLSGTVVGFNQQLQSSKYLMEQIGTTADKFGLSGASMAQITQLYATPLAQRNKLGTNYEHGIELAKNTMIGGEAMGLNPQFLAEAIARALSPGQSLGGKPFERLVNTRAFQGAGVMHPQQLANMQQDKKIDLVISAMSELGNNAEYLAARMNSLRVQFNMMKANLEAILKPIGDALAIPMKLMMSKFNNYLKTYGPMLGESLGKIVGDVLGDPEKLYVNIKQAAAFKGDFKEALGLTNALLAIASIAGFFKKSSPLLSKLHTNLGNFLGLGEGGAGFLQILKGEGTMIGKVLSIIGTSLSEFLPPLMAFLFLFQIISRAKAKADVDDVKSYANIAPGFLKDLVRFKVAIADIFMPLTMAVEKLSDWLEPLFETSILADQLAKVFHGLVWVLEKLGWTVVHFLASVSGMSNMDGFGAMKGLTNGENPFKALGNDFMEGYHGFLDRAGKTSQAVGKTSITNHNNVTARFDMREQLEPDRIAFAVVTHLKKLTMNNTQASGYSLHNGLNARASGAQGN